MLAAFVKLHGRGAHLHIHQKSVMPRAKSLASVFTKTEGRAQNGSRHAVNSLSFQHNVVNSDCALLDFLNHSN